MAEFAAQPGAGTVLKPHQELEPPVMFRVMMHNDDYTTMDFVVAVLRQVFHKKPEDAVGIMLSVHQNGIATCGVYTSDVAETKVTEVHEKARKEGYPLRCSMEPA